MFHVIQDAYCIVKTRKGVFKQTKVYKYSGGLYINACGGFVRLMKGGDIGTPDMSYIELQLPETIATHHDSLRRLCYTDHG